MSAGVAQPRRNPVDRQVDTALRPFVAGARAVSANQFDLQMVQGIDVRKAVFDLPGQRIVVGQALFVTSDPLQGIGCAMPFGFYRFEDFFA